ncbi:MAG: hypothetical protein AAGN66_00470 [Acidobacteriota bacterium]
MRTLYHEFESLEHLLTHRLLPGGEHQPVRFAVFGGTGAVGGAAVMELCRLILMSKALSSHHLQAEIHATGLGDREIEAFVSRLRLALEGETSLEEIEPLRRYRLDGRIELRFGILRLQVPSDLSEHLEARRRELGPEACVETILGDYFAEQECPFLRFVQAIDAETELLHAVVVAIPLPSVATYTLGSIDTLVRAAGLDHATGQRIKKRYLQTFVRGLAVILQRYARRVVMAHTTAVGGMYRVDGGAPEIRLGFAHSALGKKLVDKKYFADELTQLFIDQGFDVLVTAAAIGIDAVDFRVPLPKDRAVDRRLRKLLEDSDHEALDPADFDDDRIRLYPSFDVPVARGDAPERLAFGSGRDLIVDAAIRSGENGLFSVANCVALYNVMKVAIPEELAMVLVRHALFGPERRRDWFQERICYYAETENSYFALRLLDSYPQLVRGHHGAFAIQAFQALGSATHQARLHELGLLMLSLRLRQLRERFLSIPEDVLAAAVTDLPTFFWQHTRVPAFEDLDARDVDDLALEMGALCQVETAEDAGRLLGYEAIDQAPTRDRFLQSLADQIVRYRAMVTSLGIPVIYRRDDGEDRLLLGPYAAPLDLAVGREDDLARELERAAADHGVSYRAMRDWAVANNGFVDLRPHAMVSAAKEPGPALESQVRRFTDEDALVAWLGGLPVGSYFTTAGLLALRYRLEQLGQKVRQRRVELGTRETWKHLFQQDVDGRHWISPGLVETVRMYSEGLGKITGTEALWPRWGY